MSAPGSGPQVSPESHLSSPRKRLLYLVAAVAQGAGAVAVQPFAIRMMEPDEWGKVSFMLSLIAISLVAITAGLPLALGSVYFDPVRGFEKAKSLNGFGSLGSLILGALAALCVVAVGSTAGHVDWIYLLVILTITMHGVSQMSLAFLRSGGRAGEYVVVIVLATVLGHVAGLISMAAFQPTAIVYLASFSICVLAAAALGVVLTRPGNPFGERDTLGASVRMALPVLPHSLALIAMQQGESVLLMLSQGEVLVGRYNAVMPLALGPIAVILALGNVWQTVLLSLRGGAGSGRSRQIQIEAYLVAFLITLLGTGVAGFATLVLVNDPEPELFLLARLLPLLGVGYAGFLIASSQMFAVGRTLAMSVITPVTGTIMLALAFVPAQSGNLVGVGLVKVASYLMLGLAFVLVARHLAGKEVVHLRPYLLSVLASSAVVITFLFLPISPGANVLSAIASVVLVLLLGYVSNRRSKKRSRVPNDHQPSDTP